MASKLTSGLALWLAVLISLPLALLLCGGAAHAESEGEPKSKRPGGFFSRPGARSTPAVEEEETASEPEREAQAPPATKTSTKTSTQTPQATPQSTEPTPTNRKAKAQATSKKRAKKTQKPKATASSESKQTRPGEAALPSPLPAPAYESVPVPDRWRIVEALGVNERWYDPYNQNTLKADRPILGTEDWFFNLLAISDTVVEPRRLPIPVGLQLNQKPGSLDIFGKSEQLGISQTFIVSTALLKGDTVFRPPDYEIRFTGAVNINYAKVETLGALRIDPSRGKTRNDADFGVQDAYVDKHLRNRSERFDFDSFRAGIQPITSDFRGFLFIDNALGARLFGTFSNNRMQYNLGWFRRFDKNINSGLNDITELHNEDIFLANFYYQDFPVLGLTTQFTIINVWNHEGGDTRLDENGFRQRPAPVGDARGHDYNVTYLGISGDGHIDRLNITYSGFLAAGEDDRNPISMKKSTILAGFFASELSLDFDWQRYKFFGVWASGDSDPNDDLASGFDAIFENPQFAGSDTNFWTRQAIPLIFGGGVTLSGRNGMLPSLRTSKEQGQANFVNPGIGILGVGADWDVLPQLRISANASRLTFMNTAVLEKLRNQGSVSHKIGWDLSGAATYRPLFSQNIILRFSGAVLLPGQGLQDLFLTDGKKPFYSILANLILTY
jgi:hypothetical protein